MQVAEIAFDETVLPIFHDNSLKELAAKLAVPAQVPILVTDNQVIWDTLSIAEYLAEQYPEKRLWSDDRDLRALARSASALSLIHISSPRDQRGSRMPSSA